MPRSSAAARCWSSPASIGRVPPDASLVVEGSTQGQSNRPMTRSLADPTFAGRVESVESRPGLPRRIRRPEHRDVPRPRLRIPRAETCRCPSGLPGLYRLRAQGRRGRPACHGRGGDRADPGLPPQQGCRLRDCSSRSKGRRSSWRRDESSPHTYRAGLDTADPAATASSSSTPRGGTTRSSRRSSSM